MLLLAILNRLKSFRWYFLMFANNWIYWEVELLQHVEMKCSKTFLVELRTETSIRRRLVKKKKLEYTAARRSSMRTLSLSDGVSWRTLMGFPSYARNRACALSSPSPFHYVMAKTVPVVQLAAHAKSSTLYGRTTKFFRLDELLLFRIVMGYNFKPSHSLLTLRASWLMWCL